ncbi:hypothetical protein VD0002_g9629 [Verticillium dahliae]|uniref:DUF1996 domain-containing protein n=1 Tax=Verticillium dahliae TaxID=27337 RepID=A0AA44W7P8_VERDA|nr:hypothetical protein BJF96_g10334 [Verticillium dahliae]PNH26461.1 hypothetical protein BJF96_g10217 [Verticillium dahliae]PNH41752.1 hypothetical protein VD0003_g9920 [Verticillium dahliae]PNH57892.1 hypothetical protein VD0002_g9629 [Verticillium dahliae]
MRLRATTIATVFLHLCHAAHDRRTFALLQFNGPEIVRGRIDPIVFPGRVSEHVHGVMGGSAFAADATGESMARSTCTNAKAADDKSAYWFPWLYFHDPITRRFEPVDIGYVNVYYFFEPTDDNITAFPRGLQIVSGNATTRVWPGTHGKVNLNPDAGEIQPVQWTCPRWQNLFEPPSWPPESDGSTAGEVDPDNPEAGTGFPNVDCDGFASPLRADIHMPYCYDPSKRLDEYQTNMAFPAIQGTKYNCPQGCVHVPHMQVEVYWNTPAFKGRWHQGQGTQPFVLSNGDVSGYSSHADFLAAWDENVLQNVINACNVGFGGINSCPGVTPSTVDNCRSERSPLIDEDLTGALDALPGDRPLEGWGL